MDFLWISIQDNPLPNKRPVIREDIPIPLNETKFYEMECISVNELIFLEISSYFTK